MNSNNYYTFIQKKGTDSDELIKPYFKLATEYVTNIIWLTNSLLLILMICHLDKGIKLPRNSMVGSFIRSIEENNFIELQDILPELKSVNKVVNVVKHSLIGMTDNPKTTSIYLWDLKRRQGVYLSEKEQLENIDKIQKAISLAQEKLATIQAQKRQISS